MVLHNTLVGAIAGLVAAVITFILLDVDDEDRKPAVKLAIGMFLVLTGLGLFGDIAGLAFKPSSTPTPIYVIVVTPTPDTKPQ